jgi:hypothetical protein
VWVNVEEIDGLPDDGVMYKGFVEKELTTLLGAHEVGMDHYK